MNKVFINITGPLGVTEDDLINGGREVVARAGYQIGWVSKCGPVLADGDKSLLQCYLEVDDKFIDRCKGEFVDLYWNEYNVYVG